jgi:iron uptake system EfeUOB component EfeO/EfeM
MNQIKYDKILYKGRDGRNYQPYDRLKHADRELIGRNSVEKLSILCKGRDGRNYQRYDRLKHADRELIGRNSVEKLSSKYFKQDQRKNFKKNC